MRTKCLHITTALKGSFFVGHVLDSRLPSVFSSLLRAFAAGIGH
jgi:hypothetical protein